MDDLFDRIRDAQPDPLLLTNDELIRLEAWLNTHKPRLRLSELRQAARGDTRLRIKLDAERDWWEHLRFTVEYNRNRLKGDGDNAADAGKRKDEGLKLTVTEANTPADAGQGEDDEDLSPSRLKAKAVYEWALTSIDGAARMTRTELYGAIAARLEVEAAKAKGRQAELLADLRDSLPPNAEAFGKYLRDAGVKVYDGKGDRRPGRSIRRVDQV